MSSRSELRHYGVIGMKWGQHKARTYIQDTNAYLRKKQNKQARIRYKSGKMSKENYKATLRFNREKEAAANVIAYQKIKSITPKENAKISSIYKSYKNKAISTIPNYTLKKGAKLAAKAALFAAPYALGNTYAVAKAASFLKPFNSGYGAAGRLVTYSKIGKGVKTGLKGVKYGVKASKAVDRLATYNKELDYEVSLTKKRRK